MNVKTKINVLDTMHSLIFFVVGLLCLIIPTKIIDNINLLAGVTVIVIGVVEFISFFAKKDYRSTPHACVYSIITVFVGIIILLVDIKAPIATVLSIWIIINSIFKWVEAIDGTINHETKILKYVEAILSLSLGVLVIIRYTEGYVEGLKITLLIFAIYCILKSVKPIVYTISKKLKKKTPDKNLDVYNG